MAKKFNVNKFFKNILETENIPMDDVAKRIESIKLIEFIDLATEVNQDIVDKFDLDMITETIDNLNHMWEYVGSRRKVSVDNPLVDSVAVNKAKDYIADIPKVPMIDTLDFF